MRSPTLGRLMAGSLSTATALVTLGVVAAPSHAGPLAMPVAVANTSVAAVDNSAAAAQLAADWNVSLAEAQARIGRQDRMIALAEAAERAFGPAFAGAWFDHANGGLLIVGSTDDRTRELDSLSAAHGLTGLVRGARLEYSDERLAGIADQLTDQLGEANRLVYSDESPG